MRVLGPSLAVRIIATLLAAVGVVGFAFLVSTGSLTMPTLALPIFVTSLLLAWRTWKLSVDVGENHIVVNCLFKSYRFPIGESTIYIEETSLLDLTFCDSDSGRNEAVCEIAEKLEATTGERVLRLKSNKSANSVVVSCCRGLSDTKLRAAHDTLAAILERAQAGLHSTEQDTPEISVGKRLALVE